MISPPSSGSVLRGGIEARSVKTNIDFQQRLSECEEGHFKHNRPIGQGHSKCLPSHLETLC